MREAKATSTWWRQLWLWLELVLGRAKASVKDEAANWGGLYSGCRRVKLLVRDIRRLLGETGRRLDLSVCCGGEENPRGKQQDSSGRTHQNSHNCLLCTLRPLAMSKWCENSVGRKQVRGKSGSSWSGNRGMSKRHVLKTVEQIIDGRNKSSAGNVPVPPTNTRRNPELLVRAKLPVEDEA
jgi:hypothetical protein